MEENIKYRILVFLKYLGIGQGKFEANCGIGNGTINNIKDGISSPKLEKILNTYPELNMDWLISGKGDMLKSEINSQKVNGDKNQVFQVQKIDGGVKIEHNSDEGKDQLIESQERQVIQMFSALMEELKGFHDTGNRRDDRTKEQDTYIASIVKHSYLRNEENMKRIDILIHQQNEDRKDMRNLIEQQNELIRIIDRHSEKVQDRADRILSLLENKL
jgi:hypothetical protein